MLRRLTIENYHLIDRAEISFANGATMFTGETGSGKTMVLGAIGFVFGERVAGDAVARGAARALVSLEFEPAGHVRARLNSDGYDLDADENATISREMAQGGKSAVRLNGRPATAGYVREIAAEIADMIGQHEAQRLLSAAYHVDLLDRFAGDTALQARERVAEYYAERRGFAEQLNSLDRDERRAEEDVSYARFALDEIRAAAPRDGEDEQLTQRRRLLDNAEKVALALRTVQEALSGGEASAADSLGAALAALEHIGEIGSQFAAMGTQARALQSEVSDLAAAVARESEALEFDPAELEGINARLETIDRLKRKYGGSIAAVLAAAVEFAGTVDAFEQKDERRRQLRRELEDASGRLVEAAAELSKLRRTAAKRLSKAVELELQDLALGSARFDVGFIVLPGIGANGGEDIEFLFAANKGEELRKIGKGASGGELSRVLLALAVALAGARGSTALIFDEIDAGIGGATATAVGARLARLARGAQVVCVTHLAQIASWADTHYNLEKHESKNGTTITVQEIRTEKDRAAEIARMLSGESHDAALEHARVLLRQSTR